MWYALGSKYNHDHDYEALVFLEQPFELDIESSTLKADGVSAEAKDELV
jgi:hypothetical protein